MSRIPLQAIARKLTQTAADTNHQVLVCVIGSVRGWWRWCLLLFPCCIPLWQNNDLNGCSWWRWLQPHSVHLSELSFAINFPWKSRRHASMTDWKSGTGSLVTRIWSTWSAATTSPQKFRPPTDTSGWGSSRTKASNTRASVPSTISFHCPVRNARRLQFSLSSPWLACLLAYSNSSSSSSPPPPAISSPFIPPASLHAIRMRSWNWLTSSLVFSLSLSGTSVRSASRHDHLLSTVSTHASPDDIRKPWPPAVTVGKRINSHKARTS